jgi:very-short-patch-repair endonuclease
MWRQLAMPGALLDGRTGAARPALTREWLVAVGDFLLSGPRRERHPLCTLDELRAAVATQRGKRGAKALAWALDRVRHPVDSPRETLLRRALVANRLPEPDVQVEVMTAGGRRHADLGYLEARVLIEYQGDHHRTDARQWREDLTRIQLFEDAGFRTIAVTAADLDDGGAALAQRVRRALGHA